jgi:hypothetical protein
LKLSATEVVSNKSCQQQKLPATEAASNKAVSNRRCQERKLSTTEAVSNRSAVSYRSCQKRKLSETKAVSNISFKIQKRSETKAVKKALVNISNYCTISARVAVSNRRNRNRDLSNSSFQHKQLL